MAKGAPRRLESSALMEYAVRVLSGRAHSSGELRQKLLRRAARAGDVEGVMTRLKDYGYLDDRKFAESFATARLENQGLGRGRVLQDLRQHRVAPDLAARTVETLYKEVDERALIEEWIRRKYRGVPREGLFQTEKDLAAAYRRLMRAGFPSGEVVRALKKFARDPNLLDGFEPPESGTEDA